MRTSLRKLRASVLLVSSLLLALQVSGMHLHLCFDGQAPPLAFHVVHAPASTPALDFGAPHVDEVVRLSAERSTRGLSTTLDLPPVPAVLASKIRLESASFQCIDWASAPPRALRRELLPPLRGPPLTTQA